jgi:hypothetical protein
MCGGRGGRYSDVWWRGRQPLVMCGAGSWLLVCATCASHATPERAPDIRRPTISMDPLPAPTQHIQPIGRPRPNVATPWCVLVILPSAAGR